MTFDTFEYLNKISSLPDEEIDLAIAAIALSAPESEDTLGSTGGKGKGAANKGDKNYKIDRYINHLKKISAQVGKRYKDLIKGGSDDDGAVRLAALKHVLSDQHGYLGDYDSGNLDNTSLIRVIDRRKGLPICLAMLYVHAAREQGWDVAGLDVPGYFLCRIQYGGQRLIFDPSDQCRLMEAHDLRSIVKAALGENAELSSSYFEPVGNMEWLIKLQNIIKLRQVEVGDYEAAIRTVEKMRILDPDEFRLLLDAGVLYAKINKIEVAVKSLEDYIEKAPDGKDKQDAVMLLQQLNDGIEN